MEDMPTIVNLGWLYRFEDFRYAETEYDEWNVRHPLLPHIKLREESYPVYKRTPCGAWIHTYGGSRKFINLKATKKWACETWEDAIVSFIARKKRQVDIRKCLLVEAQEALRQGTARKKEMEKAKQPAPSSESAFTKED